MAEIKEPISKEIIDNIKTFTKEVDSAADSTDKLSETLKKLSEINASITTSTEKSSKKRKELTEVEKELQKTINQIEKVQAKRQAAETDLGKALAKEKDELSRLNRERRNAIKLEKTQVGSLDRLRAETAKLRRERNALNLETEEGRKELARLNDVIDQNDKKLKENTDTFTKAKINVGSYKDDITEALKEQDAFGISLGKLETLFTTTAGAVGAAAAIVTGLGKAYFSSARGAEDLARATDRLNSISRQIGNALADSAGEAGFLDRILANLQQAYLGVGSAIESNLDVLLRSQLRQIEVEEIDQERQKKAQLDRTEQLRQIRDEERNSFEERKAANDELATLINTRESETIAFQEKRLGILQNLLNLDKGNLEIQKQIKQVEFEIADAREEAQGFRSEQLANDLALSREFNANELALTQKKIEGQILLTEEGTQARFELEKKLIEITRDLQIKAAGENSQLRAIAIQEAINSQQQLTQEFTKAQKDRNKIQEDLIAELDAEIEASEQDEIASIKAFNKETLKDTEKTLKDTVAAEKKAADDRRRIQEMLKDASIDLAAQAAQGITDVLFEASSQRRDEELEQLQEQRDEDLERIDAETEEDLQNVQDKLDAGIISEDEAASQRDAINARSAAEKERIDKAAADKEASIKTKQAKAEKAASLADVAINTAVSITKAFAQLGPILAPPLVPFLVAQGAIQAATILATPIPKFEKGTKSAPDGLISTAEKGFEMVIPKKGNPFLTPNDQTFYSGLGGAQIIPHEQTKEMLSNMGMATNLSFNDGQINYNLNRIEKAIKKGYHTGQKDNKTFTKRYNRMMKKSESRIKMMRS